MTARRMKNLAAAVLLALVAPGPAQTAPGRLTFEVASIRPADTSSPNGGIKPIPRGYGYLAQNFPVKLMISLMYKIPMRQIDGAPDWSTSERYDIQAKADKPYSVDDLHIMFQNLLADRFNLKFHTQSREAPVFLLTIDKSGLKMKPNDSPQDYKIPVTPGGAFSFNGARVPMPYLCWFLSQQLDAQGRTVIDRTGLTGNYDFVLSYAPELPPGVSRENLSPELLSRPSLPDALREQLGLRLDAGKGPVETMVIDRLDRPSPN